MKIIQINTTCATGSTGKICISISNLLNEKNIENYILYSSGFCNYRYGIKYTNSICVKLHTLLSRIFGNYGFENNYATKKLLKHISRIQPDIIHIHNVHSHAFNLGTIFEYVRKNNIKIYYTFHDCWAFTGYCPYFDMLCCEKWKTECNKCSVFRRYSWFFDRSKSLFNKKMKLLSNLNMTIVTPSEWLARLVKQSFLKDYPVKVINNGIDLTVFKPTESDFRKKYNCENKYIILGVALGWSERKGLDVFTELSNRLDEEKYQIVLVGTNKSVDCVLPKNIISIHRTHNQVELAEVYTAADVFVNPTREDNYPTVNMEAIACGTPVITFNTGGSPEILDDKTGMVVERGDIDAMEKEVVRICNEKPFSVENCLKRANLFKENDRYKEYYDLFTEFCNRKG